MSIIGKPKPVKEKKGKKPPKPKVKRLDPDYFFSLCVRERANWTCEACGKHYDPWVGVNGYLGNPGLHCSHYIGRANYATRFDPMNANAHCYGCHSKFEGNPHIFKEWKLARLGHDLYDILIEKSNNIMLGKQARHEKQQIAEHYLKEYERMRELRGANNYGRLNFTGYL